MWSSFCNIRLKGKKKKQCLAWNKPVWSRMTALKMWFWEADITNLAKCFLFCRNMIKSFYTASLLIDVLTVFGELSEEVSVRYMSVLSGCFSEHRRCFCNPWIWISKNIGSNSVAKYLFISRKESCQVFQINHMWNTRHLLEDVSWQVSVRNSKFDYYCGTHSITLSKWECL